MRTTRAIIQTEEIATCKRTAYADVADSKSHLLRPVSEFVFTDIKSVESGVQCRWAPVRCGELDAAPATASLHGYHESAAHGAVPAPGIDIPDHVELELPIPAVPAHPSRADIGPDTSSAVASPEPAGLPAAPADRSGGPAPEKAPPPPAKRGFHAAFVAVAAARVVAPNPRPQRPRKRSRRSSILLGIAGFTPAQPVAGQAGPGRRGAVGVGRAPAERLRRALRPRGRGADCRDGPRLID